MRDTWYDEVINTLEFISNSRAINAMSNEALSSHLLLLIQKLALRISTQEERIQKLEKESYSAANTASCLANGILPD